jgi:hypothetical protein
MAASTNIYGNYGYDGHGGYAVDPPRHRHHARHAARRYSSPKENIPSTHGVAQSCGGLAPGVADLPVDRIEQTVRPTEDQRPALEDLKGALAKAAEILKTSSHWNRRRH